MRQTTFTLDGQTSYKGYTADWHWNGFDCPYFELSEAQKILDDVTKEGYLQGKYLKSVNSFVIDGEIYGSRATVIEGKEIDLYPVGAYAWTWKEVKTKKRKKL